MESDPKKDFLRFASLGLEIAVAVFLCAFIGYKIDIKFHSKPWGMVVGVILGAAAGMWNAYKLAVKNERT
jgi:F0F1-type ATP synthase assembly protein I